MTKARVNADNASADIQGVTAGTGLSGGGTSGTVTLTNDMATTIAAKGDLVVGTANDAYAALTVGTNTHLLMADSATGTGLKWALDPTQDLVTTKGDIVAATAADTLARLGVGANDTVLTADSSTSTGLKWATPSAGGMTLLASGNITSNFNLTSISGSYKDLRIIIRSVSSTASSGGDNRLYMRINSNTGSSYGNIEGNSYGNADYTPTAFRIDGLGGSVSTRQNLFVIDIYDYANTSTLKMVRSRGFMNHGTNPTTAFNFFTMYGVFNSTAAVSTVNFLGWESFSHTLNNGSYLLYGVS